MIVLAGDIGGTNTRLALFDVQGYQLDALVQRTFPSSDYSAFEDILDEFTDGISADCTLAGFGVAGPVREGRSEITNLPWIIDAAALSTRFGWRQAVLLNDLEANAWGIQALTRDDLHTLNGGRRDAAGNAAVIAAGTGLGEAGLCHDGQRYIPFACEGGHTDFAVHDDIDFALFAWLEQRFGHVSWERVVSGIGLVNIYNVLLDHHNAQSLDGLRDDDTAAAAISAAGMAQTDLMCTRALDMFVRFYGAEAGNLALKLMATGGVYLGGGIAPKILERLNAPGFMSAFTAKGRMSALMRDMPVHIILNDQTALFGAALGAVHARH